MNLQRHFGPCLRHGHGVHGQSLMQAESANYNKMAQQKQADGLDE